MAISIVHTAAPILGRSLLHLLPHLYRWQLDRRLSFLRRLLEIHHLEDLLRALQHRFVEGIVPGQPQVRLDSLISDLLDPVHMVALISRPQRVQLDSELWEVGLAADGRVPGALFL